jgi:hypothetical protein
MTMTTQKKRKARSPRTKAEAICDDNYTGSHYCVGCAQKKKRCVFEEDKQQCILCKLEGTTCQLLGQTWLHSHASSKLGRRSACIRCANRKKKCVYNDNDEYNFKTTCSQCKDDNVPCCVGVNLRGARNHTTLLSGVHQTVVAENNMEELVAIVTFDTAAKVKATIDHPMNSDAKISTQRPARVRNNFGLCLSNINLGEKRYKEIVSYGSGCGATSVGTTFK